MRNPLIGFSVLSIVSIAVTGIIWSTLQRSIDGDSNSYSATFNDASGLKPGDDVRMAGARVGRVQKIELDDNYKANVEFVLQNNRHIYGNTRALVHYQNLNGQRFVALAPGPGDAAPLDSGGTIPVEQTESSFDISVLLGGFEPLFSVLKPRQVNSLAETLIQAVQGDAVSLDSFITQVAALATTFAESDAILDEVVSSLNGVLAGLAKQSTELESLIAQTKTLVGALHDQRQWHSNQQAAVAVLVDTIDPASPSVQNGSNSTTEVLTLLLGNGPRFGVTADNITPPRTGSARFSGSGFVHAYMCSLDVAYEGALIPHNLVSQIGADPRSEECR